MSFIATEETEWIGTGAVDSSYSCGEKDKEKNAVVIFDVIRIQAQLKVDEVETT